ncbi:Flp pilus assembly protein CpaB [Alicyclobacillus sp.]|uniref:Flp pilus assembly protein CpaB n=1 Tax=Alicyclobacillus sp. TaxID=61169 RepID=UPI0025BA3FAC|nr:Flp pilus assembly protein CpaB [Alicyclobacillus sp.]MCL6517838.1 Flp pilus assembly protein CpaB [Alicyclobacillus sp.]
MGRRAAMVLWSLALVLAVVTTLVVRNQMEAWRRSLHAEPTRAVVVVVKEVAPHQLIDGAAVALRQVSVSGIAQGALTRLTDVVGRYAATRWFPGQQVVQGMVTPDSAPAAFPLSIPAGYRAFTIADDPVTGVDHLISPGDRVDVLVAYADAAHGGPKVQTVLTDVLVLYADHVPPAKPAGNETAGGDAGTGGSTRADTLTLAVTPSQAEQLEYARTFGKLHLVLRGPSDTGADAGREGSVSQGG